MESLSLLNNTQTNDNNQPLLHNKKYLIIPINVFNQQFQLMIGSYDCEFIHESCLLQSNQTHPIKSFLCSNNQFIKKYYDRYTFPIHQLKRMKSFSFGSFNGYFSENYFHQNELLWYSPDEFFPLSPHFVSHPLVPKNIPFRDITTPFTIAFQCSDVVKILCSKMTFLLMENMNVIEEKTVEYDIDVCYCKFTTPFNQISNSTYLKIVIDLIDHQQLYVDGGCYLFDEYGYLLTEKYIRLFRQTRRKASSPTMKIFRNDDDKDQNETEENWKRMFIVLSLSSEAYSYENNTLLTDENDDCIYQNGYINAVKNYRKVIDRRTEEIMENPYNSKVVHGEMLYFTSNNKEIKSEDVFNGLLFGNISEMKEEWIQTLKQVRSDAEINEYFVLEIVKRRYYIFKNLDLECCKSCLLILKYHCDSGENHMKQSFQYLYSRIKHEAIELTLLEVLMFAESGFIDFAINLIQFINDKELIEIPKLLVIFILLLKEKGNVLQERLKEIYSHKENKDLFIKFLWMIVEYNCIYTPYIDEWYSIFDSLYESLYPNDIHPSEELITNLINVFNDDSNEISQPLLHPFNNSPIVEIIERTKGKTLEAPVTLHFRHQDGSESKVLHKDNFKTIESNILLYIRIIAKLCNASYEHYEIFNYKENKFVQYVPNCISLKESKSKVDKLINIPKLHQLGRECDIKEQQDILHEFDELLHDYKMNIEYILQPQYIRKKNLIESASLAHIFWCLLCLIDRHQKNILYSPMTGNFFHIDLTFPSHHNAQLLNPIQYWIFQGMIHSFDQMKSEHILKQYIKHYMNIIMDNKGKIYSFLQTIRRSFVIQIDRMCETMFMKDITEMVVNEKLWEIVNRLKTSFDSKYEENVFLK